MTKKENKKIVKVLLSVFITKKKITMQRIIIKKKKNRVKRSFI
jgi:hypothetical protein